MMATPRVTMGLFLMIQSVPISSTMAVVSVSSRQNYKYGKTQRVKTELEVLQTHGVKTELQHGKHMESTTNYKYGKHMESEQYGRSTVKVR